MASSDPLTDRPADPTAGAPSDGTTLTAVLDALAEEGYAGNATVDDDGAVRCSACRELTPADEVGIERIRRLEGASDPADQALVLGIRCGCGAAVALVVRYGPEAGAGDAAFLSQSGAARSPAGGSERA